ncbi:MAG TPA: hypothetical protein VGQ12_02010 [Candidatus Angelobacter sp.]|jgi:hypothetical protein|nr:hypothetical protein [Candidatus Angelobacter sp.]
MAENGGLKDSTASKVAEDPFLRKQAWDYFNTHASQRMAIFNFYVVLSSLTMTSYFASFKSEVNFGVARAALAILLCLFAFVFWKLDSRNKFLMKNAERALRYFEAKDENSLIAKVFSQEELETDSRKLKGWKRSLFWKAHLSYSKCFNLVYSAFFALGILGFVLSFYLGKAKDCTPIYQVPLPHLREVTRGSLPRVHRLKDQPSVRGSALIQG